MLSPIHGKVMLAMEHQDQIEVLFNVKVIKGLNTTTMSKGWFNRIEFLGIKVYTFL